MVLRPSIVIPGIQGCALENLYPIVPATTWSTLIVAEGRLVAPKFEDLALADHSSLELAGDFDQAMVGLAEALKDKPRAEVRAALLERIFASTAEHEAGHVIGLRHNFAGSFDAFGFALVTLFGMNAVNGFLDWLIETVIARPPSLCVWEGSAYSATTRKVFSSGSAASGISMPAGGPLVRYCTTSSVIHHFRRSNF